MGKAVGLLLPLLAGYGLPSASYGWPMACSRWTRLAAATRRDFGGDGGGRGRRRKLQGCGFELTAKGRSGTTGTSADFKEKMELWGIELTQTVGR